MSDPTDIKNLALEVAGSNFSDERLNSRLRTLVSVLAADPSVSLPRTFDGAGLEAAYRFFSNPRVTPDDILSSHFEATRLRCAAEHEFLVIHDSTTFSYRFDGQRDGLGRAQPRNSNSRQAFFAHASLAVTADGTRRPLGVVALTTWTRGEVRSGVEHLRWEIQARAAASRLGNHDKAIHVMDREADDYEMFVALARGHHRFIVRCQYNRWLEEEPKTKLKDVLVSLNAAVQRQAHLSRRTQKREPPQAKAHPPRRERTAQLSIAAAKFVLRRPKRCGKSPSAIAMPPSLAVNIVRIWEPEPPPDEVPVEWILYTTDPIDTPEQLITIADRYRARWTIEEYFKAIKTGCDFERRQLREYEALVNLLATFVPIAYRLLLIRSEARRAPHTDASTVLSSDQLDVLRAKGRIRLSDSPTVRDVYLAVAALGGHIKYSGDPGWLTLARGFEKLETLTEGWVAAKLQLSRDQR
jgi:hypothetical protein